MNDEGRVIRFSAHGEHLYIVGLHLRRNLQLLGRSLLRYLDPNLRGHFFTPKNYVQKGR
jgi:hypothetical protein